MTATKGSKRIVFLGIDGVLNTWPGPLAPELVERLNVITRATGAVIVVHSSRRYRESLSLWLKDGGVEAGAVRASTPHVTWLGRGGICVTSQDRDAWCEGMPSRADRAVAIQHWLNDHPEVERFVILDDCDELGHFVGRPEFIRTNRHEGLTDAHVARAIEVLHG